MKYRPSNQTFPKWLRILIPSVLIVIWFTLAGVGGPYFGKISQVSSNDQAVFLPESAESTKVNEQIGNFQDSDAIPAVIVFSNNEKPLSEDQIAGITKAITPLTDLKEVKSVAPPIVSNDKKAAFAVVNIETSVEYKEFLPELRKEIAEKDPGVQYKITGPVGFLDDLSKAFAGIDGLLLLVALGVVFIILLVVYRSPFLPFIVLLNAISALAAAILVVWHLANIDVIEINGQVQGILFILVIGAATDYSLLFVSRYREELERHKETWQAVIAALKGSFEPILAAGGTVIVGLLCLLLSDLNSNKALGPVGAIGITLAVLSALTFLPAMLAAIGRKVFWPRIPKYSIKLTTKTKKSGIWPKIGAFVSSKPRTIWVVCTAILLVSAVGIIGLKADGIAQSDIVIGKSEARDGQALLNRHFAGGSGTPVQIIADEKHIDDIAKALESDGSVSAVQVVAVNTPTKILPLGKEAENSPLQFAFPDAKPKVVDGKVLIQATLKESSETLEAQNVVKRLRSIVHEVDSTALIGGISATQLDTNIAAEHDRMTVIPVVLVVITIILMVLLRSIAAPLILLLTTVLSFAATLGVSALLFNNVFHFAGSDPSVVLYGFVFLVALGIDYNIFLMTRVREESLKMGTKKGVILGLVVTGGVITSAGIVLAATFAALVVIPVLFLVQLAFIVAFGVLLDTTIVRSLFVPALIHDIGKYAWWPVKKPKN